MTIEGLGDLKLDSKFTNINPDELPEELKDTYKQMQSHFTTRVQEALNVKKGANDELTLFTQEKKNLETQLETLKEENKNLQTSLNVNPDDDKDGIFKFLEDLDGDPADSNAANNTQTKIFTELTNQISSLTTKITGLEQQVEEKTSNAMKVVKYQQDISDITDLHREAFGEKLDRQKLIDHALETKNPDLHQAYESFTRERTIDKKAEERAQELYKERMEKDEDFASGSGGTPIIFARDEGAPKTMSEATERALKEVRVKK